MSALRVKENDGEFFGHLHGFYRFTKMPGAVIVVCSIAFALLAISNAYIKLFWLDHM